MLEPRSFAEPRPDRGRVTEVVPSAPLSHAELYPFEVRRWVLLMGTPMLGACVFIALALATRYAWAYAGVVLLGPGLGIGAIIYLALSTDTNGSPARPVRKDARQLRSVDAPTARVAR